MTNLCLKKAGFSYIEVLMALAILTIIIVPVLPALRQAQANHRYGVLRHQAQSQAVALALEVHRAPGNAADIIQRMAIDNDEFMYRVSLIPVSGGSSQQYVIGDVALIPPSSGTNFQTSFGDLFTDGIFVVAEVFDRNGNLAGFSVGKVN